MITNSTTDWDIYFRICPQHDGLGEMILPVVPLMKYIGIQWRSAFKVAFLRLTAWRTWLVVWIRIHLHAESILKVSVTMGTMLGTFDGHGDGDVMCEAYQRWTVNLLF